ncbi:hypothetical protein M2451_001965 [Dysgonomonas sp. PFB1-18]|uniref:hypothetical protein n=1 Tax=unclassified Dysgonomonas TaxID=2630389 RepID=UPI0024762029|nr:MULTISPECIES: hypothetical protein [unclassified Dysgonomonas]MDH6309599.1 hypothetical protein [Dysgonomonas sp. PF1-14]MDH6339073.1 hypothetical protein [Dysgonomonas sp. PF1-16]MDH6380641.1 hypothetical protein [Dysgonomonas sp. PFB1-18]MDH6398137.1 hypothetical protein [Dysgonomonas sp. PF1-23]
MKIYFTILCILCFLSCHNPNNKEIAQNKVEDYIININKKSNYKPILFGELDSAFTSVKHTKLYKEYNQRRGAFEAMEILSKQYTDIYSEDEVKSNKEQEMHFQAICDSLESAFTPKFIGWKIQHIYKYKNSKSEDVVDNHIFFLDKEKQNVIKDEQVYTNLPYNTYFQDTVFYGIKK